MTGKIRHLEHPPCKREVRGSSPLAGTKIAEFSHTMPMGADLPRWVWTQGKAQPRPRIARKIPSDGLHHKRPKTGPWHRWDRQFETCKARPIRCLIETGGE